MNTETRPEAGEWLPIFIRLAGQPVLVAGGGVEARRKIDRLLKHGAQVDVLANMLEAPLDEYRRQSRIRRIEALPSSSTGYRLVIVATDDERLRRAALAFAAEHAIPVNAVDDPDNCTAILPAIVDRAPITIAIGSAGTAPELARMIRSRIETLLPQTLGPLARLASELKDSIRHRFPSLPRRRRFLGWLFRDAPAEAMQAGDPSRARALAARALEDSGFDTGGSVALVGAGPGDPELLTLKALRLIQEADVIIHDALVDARILDYARRDADFIDVAKRGGKCSTPQLRINNLMLSHARAGRRVVRLKGGDSMVFGRGGEELEFLRTHEIEYSVVPGITAAAGCAAYAGIPLTHRDHAHSVHLVTAHGKDSIDRLDWASLARENQTLAFYMAVARLSDLQANLRAHGQPASTPVAIVENGARPEQRVLTGRLDRLHDLAVRHSVASPAMVYVGEVARLADRLGWYGSPPLSLECDSPKLTATA
ncbi:MAG: uroporphyrinogen-III C-methyltransferase [Xanthomonadales bacterium]|nr:uroporphyrinogen-III C-methyltransferase [Xanthomonadales bacterium]